MSQQDWWAWQGTFWREVLSGQTTEPVPVDPDPDDPDQDDDLHDPSSRNVLLVTDTGGLSAGNQALEYLLIADGWNVTVRSFAAEEDYAGMSVVVLSTGNPTGGSSKYLYPPVGIVAVDSWRQLQMGEGLGFATSPLAVDVVQPASPLAAGYSGTFDAYQAAAWLTWKPETDAALQTVVTRSGQPTQRVVFGYEAGSQMPGRYATTRHVGLGYHVDGFAVGLSVQARAQFLAAVRWARDTSYVAVPVPAAPTGLSAAPSDSQVRLSWASTAFASSYTPKRATVTGGPYTDLATAVAATTYTDSTAVNGTPYFYVVSAKSASGQGPNSAEVTATPAVSSSENVAMLATSAEIAMWQSRSTSGPFRVGSDFAPNSPGHWSEMSAAMSLNFASARWDGPATLTSAGAVAREDASGIGNSAPFATRNMAHDMMSAAYAALVTGNTSVAAAIRTEIEYHATRPRLNYANRTLWPYNYYDDTGPLFAHAIWVKDLLLAYDVVKTMGYPSEIAESWFRALADLSDQSVHSNMAAVFPNRKSNSYVLRASFVDQTVWPQTRLANGSAVYYPRILLFYNNRRNNLAGFAGLYGALTGDAFFIAEFKRYMREWVDFGHSVSGSNAGGFGDINRGGSDFPQLGFSYALHALEAVLPAMDALARQGDTAAYDYSNTDGSNAPTWGTNHLKSTETVLNIYMKWIDRTYPAHYDDSGAAGNEFFRIHSRNTGNNREIINDGNILLAANYFDRSDWQNIILRVGTPSGYTSPPQGVGTIQNNRADWRQRFLRSLDANPYGGA
jgi:hypothetical protein